MIPIRKIFVGLSALALPFIVPTLASAAVLFSDTFDDNTKINTSATSARHNQASGHMEAPKKPTPNAIALAEYGNEYAVVNGNSVQFYAFDGVSAMHDIPSLEIPITNPLGLTMRADSRALWVFTDTDVKYYDFAGGTMSNNPSLSVLGLSGVVSVSSQPNNNNIAVLTDDGVGGKTVRQYMDNGGTLVENTALAKAITIANPISVSTIPGTMDFVVAGASESKYYAYDSGLNDYVENPYLATTGLSNATAFTQNATLAGSIEGSTIKRYDPASNMSYSIALSKSVTDTPVALSMKTSSYDFAYVNDNGEVKYYAYSGTTMVENQAMGTTSLTLNGGYLSGKLYQSNVFTSATSMQRVRLTTTESNDPSTAITYRVSSDNAVTWTSVTPNTWTIVPDGTQFAVRATFTTPSKTATPRLQSIQLEVDVLDLIPPTITLNTASKQVVTENNYIEIPVTASDNIGTPTLSYATYSASNLTAPLVGSTLTASSFIAPVKVYLDSTNPALVNGGTYVIRITATDSQNNTSTADIKVKIDNSMATDPNTL